MSEYATLEEVKMLYVLSVLRENNWNKTHTCRVLGISDRALYMKLKRHFGEWEK